MNEDRRPRESGTSFAASPGRRPSIVWIVIPALLAVWLVALLGSATFGGWAHLLPLASFGLAVWLVLARFRGRHLTGTSRKH